jgi:hypothetical protein
MNVETAYRWRQQLVWGILLIAVGCAVLAERAGYLEIDIHWVQLWRYWPWLLVVSGITKIIPPTTPRYLLNGTWEIFFAGWWYVSFNRIWGWGFSETWPALLVAWGVGLMLRPLLENIFAASKDKEQK